MKYLYAFCFLFFSCAPAKFYPIKGQYLAGPYEIKTTSTKDHVWDKVIDLFSQKGLPIKLIDKSSGLIVSEKSKFQVTVEDKAGKLVDNTALIVVPAAYDSYHKKFIVPPVYSNLSAEWNIRIKNDNEGNCIINVNIVNMSSRYYDLYTKQYREIDALSARSTGFFERMVSEYLK